MCETFFKTRFIHLLLIQLCEKNQQKPMSAVILGNSDTLGSNQKVKHSFELEKLKTTGKFLNYIVPFWFYHRFGFLSPP